MTRATLTRRERHVRRMFDRLSKRYDLINRLISLGQDLRWRRILLSRVGIEKRGRLLDVGTGTGSIPAEALKRHPLLDVTAIDFSLQMIRQGKRRSGEADIRWCAGDALNLPFPDASFDAATSAFLVRNVSEPRRAFEEQLRVVKPGGLVGCLETSPPSRTFLYPLVLFHLRAIIPFLGRLIGREAGAYTYLPDTTRAFMRPENLAATMKDAGLQDISYRTYMFGVMAIHVGRRPS